MARLPGESYPQVPEDRLPEQLRSDINWVTPWLIQEFDDDSLRVDWRRYGIDGDGGCGFSSMILYDGENAGWQEWQPLIDEHQMGIVILRNLGIETDQPAISLEMALARLQPANEDVVL